MRISDWSSDVCSSDLLAGFAGHLAEPGIGIAGHTLLYEDGTIQHAGVVVGAYDAADNGQTAFTIEEGGYFGLARITREVSAVTGAFMAVRRAVFERSAEHTSDLQSLMRISYAVFCLTKKQNHT